MKSPPRLYYVNQDGQRIYVPRLPIERTNQPIPGPITRWDGTVLYIQEEEINE